jgi:hypothetical protein
MQVDTPLLPGKAEKDRLMNGDDTELLKVKPGLPVMTQPLQLLPFINEWYHLVFLVM